MINSDGGKIKMEVHDLSHMTISVRRTTAHRKTVRLSW